ncbi:MAG: CAP domain-containing protein [Rhizobiaceae bacterium]|nr:CAP domain-containing protein [Rhizobiaceae bacterium]
MRILSVLPVLAALLAACASTNGSSGVGASASAAAQLSSIRSEAGLPPLAADASLEKAAAVQAGYMAADGRMAHTTGWGKDFASRMRKAGINGPAAENIAAGRMDVERLFAMWMASDGHRRNMLDPRFGHFGLASADGGDGSRYWALVLGR